MGSGLRAEGWDFEPLLVEAGAKCNLGGAAFVLGEIVPKVLDYFELTGRREVAGIAGPGLLPFSFNPKARPSSFKFFLIRRL